MLLPRSAILIHELIVFAHILGSQHPVNKPVWHQLGAQAPVPPSSKCVSGNALLRLKSKPHNYLTLHIWTVIDLHVQYFSRRQPREGPH